MSNNELTASDKIAKVIFEPHREDTPERSNGEDMWYIEIYASDYEFKADKGRFDNFRWGLTCTSLRVFRVE